jgi:hypothetical protein
MTTSVIPQLVAKDLRLMRPIILGFVAVSLFFIGLLSLLWAQLPVAVAANLGFIMVIAPAATCGIVVLMKTNVFEKEKSTQPFIMSLPVTVKEFTQAKLWVNLPLFTVLWGAVSAVAFYFAFGRGLLPLGAVPFVSMVFVGGFVAYACILATSLLTQSMPMTVLGIAVFEAATSGYMWAIAFFPPIAQHVWGAQPVWNAEAIVIIAAQVLVAVCALAGTLLMQTTKRDFI